LATKIKNIGTIYEDKVFCVQIDGVTNLSDFSVQDIFVTVDVPEGVVFSSGSLPQGTYDSVAKIWTVGTLLPLQSIVGQLCFQITDECLSSFQFNVVIDSLSSCDGCLENNSDCKIYQGYSCCELNSRLYHSTCYRLYYFSRLRVRPHHTTRSNNYKCWTDLCN
jgi:hypothetical protein